MKFLVLLSTMVLAINTYAADQYKAQCEYLVGGSVHNESATVSGPLLDHDFRIRFFDHEGEQAMTGRCYLSDGEADCFDKDMFGNDDHLILKLELVADQRINPRRLPDRFYLSFKDDEGQKSLMLCRQK